MSYYCPLIGIINRQKYKKIVSNKFFFVFFLGFLDGHVPHVPPNLQFGGIEVGI